MQSPKWKKEFESILNAILGPDTDVLEDYLEDYLRTVNEAIDEFKKLDELSWFDHNKIKST